MTSSSDSSVMFDKNRFNTQPNKNSKKNKAKSVPRTNKAKEKKVQQSRLLQSIRKGRKLESLCFRKLPFQRLVREITRKEEKKRRERKRNLNRIRGNSPDSDQNEEKNQLRFTKQSLSLLQRTAEMKLLRLFEDSYMCTLHAKRVTLFNKDVRLAKILTREYDD